jgi:hypothetical protein
MQNHHPLLEPLQTLGVTGTACLWQSLTAGLTLCLLSRVTEVALPLPDTTHQGGFARPVVLLSSVPRQLHACFLAASEIQSVLGPTSVGVGMTSLLGHHSLLVSWVLS